MFTSIDKAIVGLIMAAVFLINNFTGWHFALSEDVVNGIAGVLTPFLIWLTPNRTA